MIRFPIIRRIDIRGYQLFQNEKSEGIAHQFERGVHAVVGVNGLGKTTLLTILYRVLLGPYDQSKSDDVGLLGSQHALSAWRNKTFFRDRVADGAADATVEADIAFGEDLLTIRRRLANLQIEHLSVNGNERRASADEYQAAILELSGVATFFDFFAILRYLVFFLEDRVELIWDRRSQFDMLRILLFDKAPAKAASEAYDDAQAADSRFRNRRAVLGKDRERLAELEAAAGHAQTSQVRALQAALAQAEQRDAEQATKVEESRQRVEDARLRRERALLDLQEAHHGLELEEQAHYKHLFPGIGDTAQYVFLSLLGGSACLVCGSSSDDVANHLRAKLDEHRCPICNSPASRHETITTPAEFSRARLRRLKGKVDQLRTAIATASQDIEKAEAEHRQLVERREEDRKEWTRLRNELRQLGPIEIPTDADLERLRAAVEEGQSDLERLRRERTAAEARYRRIIRAQEGIIDKTVRTIRRRFRQFASVVLTERCELNITSERRPIGQEGENFEFPYFEVMMTSGIFDQSLSTRNDKDAVSESQREFLDIAFRLALIEAITEGDADSMLVLETPEASLDSLFIAKAGEVFRHYAENAKRRNVLIASTNLNNEEMLGALLGTRHPPARARTRATTPKLRRQPEVERVDAPVIPAAERASRVINLLDLAAPNAALRGYRSYYTSLLRRALGEGSRRG